MTFLSISPETFDAPAATRRVMARGRPRASVVAQCAAVTVVIAGLTVPGALVQAKWNRLAVIVSIVQHRCLAAVSA